jgi:4-hydroxy-3-methylbut-2-en-1-yl diphosphate synthase IspG/GcpE
LVADIHFNPKAADVAAGHVEKVRINPGNYIDKAKRFNKQTIPAKRMPQKFKRFAIVLSLSSNIAGNTGLPSGSG